MRKKLFTCLIALVAMLTFSPQAWGAESYPLTVTESTPLTIFVDGYSNPKIEIVYGGTWESGVTKPVFEYQILNQDGSVARMWDKCTVSGAKMNFPAGGKCTSGNTMFILTGTGSASYPTGYGLQLRLASGSTWNVTSSRYITIKTSANQYNRAAEVCGNVMSLVLGSSFASETNENRYTIPCEYCFYKLFADAAATNYSEITASRLILPATMLKAHCYEDMFSGWGKYLKSGPQIKATTLVGCDGNTITDACKNMFKGCSQMGSLTTNLVDFGKEGTIATTNWMSGVKSSGTFTYCGALSTTTRDEGHIPSEWTLSASINQYVFNANGGAWSDGCKMPKVQTSATAPTAPVANNITADGYTTDKDGLNEVITEGFSSNTTYYAHYGAPEYETVTISNVQNGSISVVNTKTSASVESGSEVLKNTTLKVTATPASADYVFKNWVFGPSYEPEIAEDGTFKLTDDLTIGAEFRYAPFTVNATSEHATVTLTAAGLDQQTNIGRFATCDVTLNAVPENAKFEFKQWSDGNTQNPRTIAVNSNVTVSAEYEQLAESDAKTVNIYQSRLNSSTIDTTRILYALYETTDAAGNTYKPIDMGYGVAWADRNVGATSSSVKGDYFYWGSTTKMGSSADMKAYCSEMVGMQVGDEFSVASDAASQNMGKNEGRVVWRTPSYDEMSTLKDNCDVTLNSGAAGSVEYASATFKYKYDTSKQLIFCTAGMVYSDGLKWEGERVWLWTRTLKWINPPTGRSYPYSGPGRLTIYVTASSSTPSIDLGNLKMDTNTPAAAAAQGMNVRGIYTPPFNTHKLTIKVQNETSGTASTKAYVFMCEEGQKITVNAIPTDGTVKYFSQWSDGNTEQNRTFVMGTEDKNVTAIFSATQPVVKYTVTIEKNEDTYGTISATSIPNVEEGTDIIVNGNTLTIGTTTITATPAQEDALNTYAFDSWTIPGGATEVTAALTITANFTATPKAYFELVDDKYENDGYYTTLASLVGQEKDVQYIRTFPAGTATAPSWNAFSLPFDYNIEDDTQFQGKVVQLDHATYDDATSTLTLYFVYQNIYLNANQPYVFYNTGDALENPVFNEVTIVAPEVVEDNVVSCSPQGQVSFKNTIVRGPLPSSQEHDIAFIYNNELGYSKGNNSMRAFRGYFEMDGVRPSGSSAPRRIVMMVDETTALVCDMDVETNTTKKVIEDGILYIERNGVRYNAQGATIR